MTTASAHDQSPAHARTLVPVGTQARKIDRAPADVTHPLATGRYQSPLRYPGAKSGLSKVIGEIIASAQHSASVNQVDLLVEPFAGGASTALRLVGAGVVQRVLLADADPMVAAFWQVAASRTQEIIERITDEHAKYVAVGGATALERWDYWRSRTADPGSSRATVDLELATRCLFLNRTTFSGILHGQAGPIGGRAQTSEYGIGCRFNLQGLIERLEYIGHLYNTGRLVDVWQSDWKATLYGVASHYKTLLPDRVVAYLDPPYLSKSGKLYRRSTDVRSPRPDKDLDWMGGLQHYELAEHLRREMQYRWILSYDYDERLLSDDALYAARVMCPSKISRDLNDVKAWHITKRVVSLNYTASARTGRGPAKELLLTTFPRTTVPINERLRAAPVGSPRGPACH